MRATARGLTVVAVAALIAGLALALRFHDGSRAGQHVAQGLAEGGAAATVLALLLVARAESRPDGLVVPERLAVSAAAGLPAPAWWGPLAAAAGSLLVTGLYVDRYTAGLGAGLLVAATVGAVVDTDRGTRLRRGRRPGGLDDAPLDRYVVRAARRLRAFADAHGGGAEAVVAQIGRYGAKIALVATDGRYGDQVVTDQPRARLACELAGIDVHDSWPRELGGRVVSTPFEWNRMGSHRPARVTSRPVSPAAR